MDDPASSPQTPECAKGFGAKALGRPLQAMLMLVPSHAHASSTTLQIAPVFGRQVPTAEHPDNSGKPQRSPKPQSASVVQVPESAPVPSPAGGNGGMRQQTSSE